jgi:hypothetical protein
VANVIAESVFVILISMVGIVSVKCVLLWMASNVADQKEESAVVALVNVSRNGKGKIVIVQRWKPLA